VTAKRIAPIEDFAWLNFIAMIFAMQNSPVIAIGPGNHPQIEP
jgi:hypothetical protein